MVLFQIKMFKCRFCEFRSKQLKPYLAHRKFHSNLTRKFHCGYNSCDKMFRLEGSLRSHLLRSHQFPRKKTQVQNIAQSRNIYFECTVQLCKKRFSSRQDLFKHLRTHIRNKEKVTCPFDECDKVYTILTSFSGHVSRSHRDLPPTITLDQPENRNLNIEDIVDSEHNLSDGEHDPVNDECDFVDVERDSDDGFQLTSEKDASNDPFLLNTAHFFLKLECQLLVPASTIQKIVEGTLSTHEQGQEVVKKNLKTRLLEQHLAPQQVDEIIKEVFNNDPFVTSTEALKSDFTRKKFYKQRCGFIEPVEVLLYVENEKKTFFHYIPIEETLRQLFTDQSFSSELHSDCTHTDPDILSDFTDGTVFQKSSFFTQYPNALKLILYQDEFEIVNPIGSAKSKHKLLGIYMSIGNLPEHVRSHVNAIKLVALCKEQYFDHEKVYGKIVEDFKKIESSGIQLASGEVIKGALVFIAGDNLGSHSLEGFLENFSLASYFCRYCLITRDEFHSAEGPFESYPPRSIENYTAALEANRNGKDHCQGVKSNSVFNSLENFHVCNPGLPPCLAHDLLEGITAFDLKIFIDYFVEERWFSISTLNKRIESFQYSLHDNRDKPCPVSASKKRIVGNAWQIFTFLKPLPLLIEDKIRDTMNTKWQCFLLLLEIVEVVCAPKVHKSYLPYLATIISEYIAIRKTFEQKLRPKHHYLMHYPELIKQFGPLMKVWTLRFESKHSYFKRAIRYCKNFINVTKSLTIKHELFQSFLRLGGDIRSEIEMRGNSDFRKTIYQDSIQQALNRVTLRNDIQECCEIIVKGVVYRRGDGLVVRQKSYQFQVEVGKVCLLLSDETNVFIVFEVLETVFRSYLRVYEVGKCVGYTCCPLNSLPSTEKLNFYNTGSFLCVKPSYGLVSRPLWHPALC